MFYKITNIILFIILLLTMCSTSLYVKADGILPPQKPLFQRSDIFANPDATKHVQALPNLTSENLFKSIYKFIIFICSIIGIVSVSITVLLMVSSEGDSTKLMKATKSISWLIVGAITISVSFSFIYGILNLNLQP